MEGGIADFEDMLFNAGCKITLTAPTKDLATTLLDQMFHERILLKTVEATKEGLWKQIKTDVKFDLWNDLFAPYFLIDNKMSKGLKNGSMIEIMTLNVMGTQGKSSDVIHIEELDKVTETTKAGAVKSKLEALAGMLPQIRARPDARLRITCNNRSGLFTILKNKLKPFGLYFPIYQEEARTMELKGLVGRNYISNEDIIWTCEECLEKQTACMHEPDVDHYLEVLMGVFKGVEFVQQQLYNADSHRGESFHPEKVELAYTKGSSIDQERTAYDHAGMAVDPGGRHATAYIVMGLDKINFVHLLSLNYYAADDWDKSRFESMLEQEAYEVALAYVTYNCQYFAYETNSGELKIAPYIGAMVARLLQGYEYIDKKWIKTDRFRNKSRATWNEIPSNFGTDPAEGETHARGISKGEYIANLRLIFDLGVIKLQERNIYQLAKDLDRNSPAYQYALRISQSETALRTELSYYDPRQTAEKYKGDQPESLLHNCYHLAEVNKEYQKLIAAYKTRKVISI
jgi:hypothetical protein